LPQQEFISGGHTVRSEVAPAPDSAKPLVNETINPELTERLIKAIERFEKKKLVVYTELIKRDLETLDKIEKQRGL